MPRTPQLTQRQMPPSSAAWRRWSVSLLQVHVLMQPQVVVAVEVEAQRRRCMRGVMLVARAAAS